MGKLIYEMKPWICLVIAGIGMVYSPKSKLAGSSSLLLLTCALLILQWRFVYRKNLQHYVRTSKR